jgi:hypothetical protein
MREIVAYCDRCWADGERREPSKGQVTIAMMPGDVSHPTPKVLDFCETCLKEVAALAELVANSAVFPTKRTTATPAPTTHSAPSKTRMVPCPVCRVSTARASLVAHIWGRHRTDVRPEMPLVCPDCNEPYDSGQGIATHRRIVHGYDALTEALSGVKGYKITGKERSL